MASSAESTAKSNIPWSVKGIARDARETAKDAARRQGMTVGEWLNSVIYEAGDASTSEGEVDGVKLKDIVAAVEHLSERLVRTESRSAAAVDDLARNVGSVLERVQRLERVKPESTADLAKRVEVLESKSTDRQRIDALKALEKAVGQVALQFDAAQKSTQARVEQNEKELQALSSRVEQGELADAGGAASAIDFLKDAVDGMSARISRAERIAAEATKLHREAADQIDPKFVEQTGSRLRVLGDEIKRGGDQIRGLESAIDKMVEKIDAAEQRSSKGVSQVAETITSLREQFEKADAEEAANTRREIEAAVSKVNEKTDARIGALQRSFEEMITRLESVGAAARASAKLADPEPAPEAATQASPQSSPQSSRVVAAASSAPASLTHAPHVDDDIEDAFDAMAFEPDVEPAAETVEEAAADPAEIAVDLDAAPIDDLAIEEIESEAAFDDVDASHGADDAPRAEAEASLDEATDDDERGTAQDADDVLADVRSAFGFDDEEADEEDAGEDQPAAETAATDADSDLASLFGHLDDEAPAEDVIDEAPNAGETDANLGADLDDSLLEVEDDAQSAPVDEDAEPEEPVDYLKAARLKAKKAAEEKAQEATAKKRKLTPKQRAILAAKIKRKKAEAQAALEESAVDEEPAPSDDDVIDYTAENKGLFARFRKSKTDDAEGRDADEDAQDDVVDGEREDAPPLGEGFIDGVRARPVTAALGAAIILVVTALMVLMKDVVFGTSDQPTAGLEEPADLQPISPPVQSIEQTAAPADTSAETALAGGAQAPALADPALSQPALDGDVVRPRDLYVESVTALRSASGEQEEAAAITGIEKAAALGHPPAQLQLGELYKTGQGKAKDLGEARSWYERAANGGNVLAMHRLGVMAARGEAGAQDLGLSVTWFERAANLGLVDSQYNLGATFHPTADGAAVQDRGKAYFWYSVASLNGDDQASALAASIAGSMTPDAIERLDAEIAAWSPQTPDPVANEIAPAS